MEPAFRRRMGLSAFDRVIVLALLVLWILASLRGGSLEHQSLASAHLAAPLTALGLWLLSLFFLRGTPHSKTSARLIQVGVLGYILVHAARDPGAFLMGGTWVLALLAWPISAIALLAWHRARKKSLAPMSVLWLLSLGSSIWLFGRTDFQHTWLTLPLLFFPLGASLAQLHQSYPSLPALWVRLPALLLAGGAFYFFIR